MPRGTLEVLLLGAKGLDGADFLSKNDPYVILTCRTQEQKSSIASGEEPEWNETFIFTISEATTELNLKIMDKDTFTADDFIGEVNIPLELVFMERNLPSTAYNVVKDQEYRGEIRLGLNFTPEDYGNERKYGQEESYGGWKESSYRD